MFPFFCISFEAIANCMAAFAFFLQLTTSIAIARTTLAASAVTGMTKMNLLPRHNHAESKPGIRTLLLCLWYLPGQRTWRKDPDPPVHGGMFILHYRSIFLPSCSDFAPTHQDRARDTMYNGSDYTQLSKDGAIHIVACLLQYIGTIYKGGDICLTCCLF